MDGKRPIDRVRENERANQMKMDKAKQRVTQDAAAVAERARAYDDEEAKRALESGDSAPDHVTENDKQ